MLSVTMYNTNLLRWWWRCPFTICGGKRMCNKRFVKHGWLPDVPFSTAPTWLPLSFLESDVRMIFTPQIRSCVVYRTQIGMRKISGLGNLEIWEQNKRPFHWFVRFYVRHINMYTHTQAYRLEMLLLGLSD